MLADNKLALNAGWDTEILAIELQALIDIEFDVTLTGFSLSEVDLTLDQASEASTTTPDGPADRIPEPPTLAACRPADLWILGRHRLLCGNAVESQHVARLIGEEKADLIFTDPPYNVPIDGNVCGLGSMNSVLPERYRLSEMMIILCMDRYDTWSKRKLLKEVYGAWRSLGVRVPEAEHSDRSDAQNR